MSVSNIFPSKWLSVTQIIDDSEAICLLNMTIYFAHYVHLNETQKIRILQVPDFDGYHYQESIIVKVLK